MGWHLCQRWHDRGLLCPFHSEALEGESQLPPTIDSPEAVPPAPPAKDIPQPPGEPAPVPVPIPDIVDNAKATAAVKHAVQQPNKVLCTCVEARNVIGVMKAAVNTVSRQRAIVMAAPQPPPPPRTEAPPNVVPTQAIGTNSPARVPAPENRDDFLRGLIEEDVVKAMETVGRQNAPVKATAAQGRESLVDVFNETGYNGEQSVRAVAGAAIERALPTVQQLYDRLQAHDKPNPKAKPPTPDKSPRQPSGGRVIRTVIGNAGWSGGGTGKHFPAPKFRGSPVSPYQVSDDSFSITFPEGDPSF